MWLNIILFLLTERTILLCYALYDISAILHDRLYMTFHGKYYKLQECNGYLVVNKITSLFLFGGDLNSLNTNKISNKLDFTINIKI